jgi:hypothetical protein
MAKNRDVVQQTVMADISPYQPSYFLETGADDMAIYERILER